MHDPITTSGRPENPSTVRGSTILRGILSNNPGVKDFTVRRILASIGDDRFDTTLMMFSLPGVVSVPGSQGIVSLPTGAIAYQLARGEGKIVLPRFILRKKVSRRALAVAIHAALPLLETVEKYLKPRWAWVSHDASRRALGLLVFMLAVAIGCPLLGFTPFHAASIFVIAMGMAEQDGLAVLLGVVAGLVALALELSSGVSSRVLRGKALQWLRKITKKLGVRTLAHVLTREGYPLLARMLRFQWTELLLLWDPERPAQASTRRAARPRPLLVRGDSQSIEGPSVLRVDECGAGVR